jgi:hypothetical protein
MCEIDLVPLSLEVEDEHLHLFSNPELFTGIDRNATPNQGRNTSSSIISFFIQSARLYRIVHQILSLPHIDENRTLESEDRQYLQNLQEVLKLDNDIVTLYSHTPTYLRQVDKTLKSTKFSKTAR